jgi:hypothetical protein
MSSVSGSGVFESKMIWAFKDQISTAQVSAVAATALNVKYAEGVMVF